MNANIRVSCFTPTQNIAKNLNEMMRQLDKANAGEIIVMPEACLSGYSHDLSFLQNLSLFELDDAILSLREEVQKKYIHLLCGSLIYEEDNWYNAGMCMHPDGNMDTYYKINLATHERGVLTAGNDLEPFIIQMGPQDIKIAIQLCREIRFPEQWTSLAKQGASIIFYLTNVEGKEKKQVWDAHLISRAAETQRFVISSNIVTESSGCSSMIIHPNGTILNENNHSFMEEINLDDVSDWYINQRRKDITG